MLVSVGEKSSVTGMQHKRHTQERFPRWEVTDQGKGLEDSEQPRDTPPSHWNSISHEYPQWRHASSARPPVPCRVARRDESYSTYL